MWKPVLGIALCAAVALGQDAATLLQRYVRYGSMTNTLPLTPEQKTEVQRLGREAMQASRQGNPGEAARWMNQGFALMQQAEWTPMLERAASLEPKLNHALLQPGQALTATLEPEYASPRFADKVLTAALVLVASREGGETVLASRQKIATEGPAVVEVKIPESVPPGRYFVEFRMGDAEGNYDTKARNAYVKRTPVLVASAESLAKVRSLQPAVSRSGNPSAEYALELVAKADRGETNPHRIDLNKEIAAAVELSAASATDPFAGKKGDLRKAYRSSVDQTLQPYRVYVPSSYDGKAAKPLVVALHGMGGDEGTLFELYGQGRLKTEAERLGFLVVCPKGRGPASMYKDDAQKDVMDVLAEVRRDYKVDADRIYMLGHSMGGFGTWSVAMDHPEVFAALGPISGGGNPAGMEKIKGIPQYVVHGDNDPTVAVNASRAMVEAGKKLGAPITYVEVAGGNHTDIVVPQFGPMLDFFAKQAKGGR